MIRGQTTFVKPRLERLEARAVPAVLHNNGGWITGFGDGFGGADTSQVEATFTTLGFTANTATYAVADDFTVPAGVLGWNLAKVKVYAYQRFAPASENTFTKLHLKIHSGEPGAGGTVVFDCSGANAIDVTGTNVFSNVYRVGSNLLNNDRAVKEITGNLCAPKRLTPGTYWLEWSAEGSAQYNPPQANVTVPWNAPDNGKQFEVATQMWTSMIDKPELGGNGKIHDIPFVLEGRSIPLGIPPADGPRLRTPITLEQPAPAASVVAVRHFADASSDSPSKPTTDRTATATRMAYSTALDELFIVLHMDGVV